MKAICVLESIVRKKDDEHCSIMASYFSENRDSVVRCSQLPQVSLREKAIKVSRIIVLHHVLLSESTLLFTFKGLPFISNSVFHSSY